ncbi:MAG: glycosyltransferase family 4 protein [Acidobacteriota bacterium]
MGCLAPGLFFCAMKILLTTDVFPPGTGGSGYSAAALARALVLRGHEVSVVAAKASDLGERQRGWEGVEITEIGVGSSAAPRRQARLASFLSRWAAGRGFDVVHAQHWVSAGAAVEAGRRVRLPVVVTVRDYWPVCIWTTMLSGDKDCPGCSYTRRIVCVGRRHPELWLLAPALPPFVGLEMERRKRILKSAQAVIAVSRHVARVLALDHTVVIPNLLDLQDIKQKLSQELPSDLPQPFLLFVGKLEPNKAPDKLLAILRCAKVGLPLVLAGEGRLEKSLREEAARHRMDVRLLGWAEHDVVLRLMQRATAVIFPSRWQEPLSRVLLEALAVGAVLVVEPTGGSEDIVVDGETALVGRTVEEMAEALRRVVSTPALAQRLREGALHRAKERFSSQVVLPQVEALYRRVAAGVKVGA